MANRDVESTEVNRFDGRLSGSLTYVGLKCFRGHAGVRYVRNRGCLACSKFRYECKRDGLPFDTIEPTNFPEKIPFIRDERAGSSRPDAIARGFSYYEGRPCVEGHTLRYVRGRTCVACTRAKTAIRRETPEYQEYQRTYVVKNAYGKVKAWVARNRGKVREYSRKYGKNKVLAKGTHTPEELNLVLRAQGNHCAYCQKSENLTLDHKTPLSREGSDLIGNIQWLCGPHNSAKGDSTDEEYRRENGVLING